MSDNTPNKQKRKRRSKKNKGKNDDRHLSKKAKITKHTILVAPPIPSLENLCLLNVIQQENPQQIQKLEAFILSASSLSKRYEFFKIKDMVFVSGYYQAFSTLHNCSDLKQVLDTLLYIHTVQGDFSNPSFADLCSLIDLGCSNPQITFVTFLSRLLNLCYPDHTSETKFLKTSIERGKDLPLVKFWLQNNYELQQNNNNNNNSNSNNNNKLNKYLMMALSTGEESIIDYLISIGADITAVEWKKVILNCLTESAETSTNENPKSNIDMLLWLKTKFPQLEAEASLPSYDLYSNVLEIAARKGYLDVMRYLISSKKVPAAVLTNDDRYFTIALQQQHLHIIKFLVEELKLKYSQHWMFSPLNVCLTTGNVPITQYLLDSPIFFNDEADKEVLLNSVSQGMFLADAIYLGHVELIEFLAPYLNVNGWESHCVPIVMASELGKLEIVKILVERCNADVEEHQFAMSEGVCGYGTALTAASAMGHLEVVRYLVEEAGANVNDNNGDALCSANENGHEDVVQYLLENCEAYEEVFAEHECDHWATKNNIAADGFYQGPCAPAFSFSRD